MQIVSHAAPLGETPQQRYASLHRALERGLESDEVWAELNSVCQTLGHRGEALHCAQQIRSAAMRARAEQEVLAPAARRERADHSGAPAASHAGSANKPAQRRTVLEAPPSALEHLLDAAQYLLHQSMPALVLVTMLSFPLVVGLGGFLTAGGSPLLLAAIAALPGLSILVVVAAMGRQILLRSSEGEGDVPPMPAMAGMLRDARSFAVDGALVTAAFGGVPICLFLAGASTFTLAAAVFLAALIAPLSFAILQVRGDLRGLSPMFALRATQRAGKGYPMIALATTLAFAPAIGVAACVLDRPAWVQIAAVGPLFVLPVFAAARLLGTWLDTNSGALGELLERRPLPVAQRARPARPAPPAPAAKKGAAQPARRTAQRPRRGDEAAARTRRSSIEGRRPAPMTATRTALVFESKTPAPEAAAPLAVVGAAPEDLTTMPGAVVLRGRERVRRGAAANRD